MGGVGGVGGSLIAQAAVSQTGTSTVQSSASISRAFAAAITCLRRKCAGTEGQ